MGWSFHRSLNFGGMRLNLSKSGVGASFGVKGLRCGISPNGRRYVRCGMDGIYYQQTLGGGRRNQSAYNSQSQPRHQNPTQQNLTGPSQPIQSADASTIVDSTSAALIQEIQHRLNTPKLHIWASVIGLAVLFIGAAQQMAAIAIIGAGLTIIGFIVGYIVYRSKSTTEIHYNLDAHYSQQYNQLLVGFEQLRKSHKLWQVDTTTAVQNSKYHGGATYLQTRKPVNSLLGMPSFLHLNRTVPMLVGPKQSLYFLPDVILVVQGRHVGAVSYYHLNFAWRETSFIEDETPARDSTQIGTTWKFVNKAGGPDRRFAQNRQLPILQISELRFQSSTGLNELIQASNVACANAFVKGLATLMQGVRHGSTTKPQIVSP